jgi:NADH:ubiquinone oxidoreductase subunit 3 (subunit A)
MDSKTKNLLIMLTVIGIITIISLIVIYKKYIKEKNTNDTVRVIKYDSTGNIQSDTTQKQITVNPVLGFVLMFIFLIIVAIILYTTILRYRLAYKSIDSGNTAIGLAALSPEIGGGIRSIFRSDNLDLM